MFNVKPNRRGLIQLLFISLSIATLINGIIFTYNINFLYMIGFMAYTQWLLIKKTRDPALLSIVPILFLNCVLYPLYSQGFTNDFNQLIGNLFTITFAAFITGRIRSITKLGSNLMLMVTLWSLFATFATSKLI